MNTKEAGALLLKVQAFDRRTVGRPDCAAWADAMTRANINLPDALEAVSQHFTATHDWLMPAHIIRLVGQIRKQRFDHAPLKNIPTDLHQERERAWLRAFNTAVGDGAEDPNAVADASLSIVRPLEITEARDMSKLSIGKALR